MAVEAQISWDNYSKVQATVLLTLSDPRDLVLTPTGPQTAASKGGYDLGVFVRGGGLDTAGDNRRQENGI